MICPASNPFSTRGASGLAEARTESFSEASLSFFFSCEFSSWALRRSSARTAAPAFVLDQAIVESGDHLTEAAPALQQSRSVTETQQSTQQALLGARGLGTLAAGVLMGRTLNTVKANPEL